MNASNQPSIILDAGGQPAPVPTYADIVAGRHLAGAEVGRAWWKSAESVPWSEAWKPTQADFADEENSAAHTKQLCGAAADSLVPRVFLVTTGGQVQALYGFRACRPLDPEGRRYAGLLGERIGGGAFTAQPKLYVTYEGVAERQHQHRVFQRVAAYARSAEEIENLFAGDPGLALAPQLEAPAGGGNPPQTWSRRITAVHPKIGALFVRGLAVRDAFKLGADLVRACPEELRSSAQWLLQYLRMAATQVGDSSALNTEWVRQDTGGNPDLEVWHLQLCSSYAPLPAVPPAPPAPPLAALEAGPPAAPEPPAGPVPNPPALSGPKRPYTQYELGTLYRLCGVAPLAEGDLVPEVLPRFWREFEDKRHKLQLARSHIEAWLDNNWPQDAPEYQRFVSTTLIQDMASLDLDGRDHHLMPGSRHKGFSVYSVYPLADGVDPAEDRRRAKAYEETMDNHRPDERAAMEQLTGCARDTPGSRNEFWEWIRFFEAATESVFGPEAPLLVYLRRLRTLVSSATHFRGHRPSDWMGYFWKYHCAVRAYYRAAGDSTERLIPFNDLLIRIRQGQPIFPQEVPDEIRPSPPAPRPRTEERGPAKEKEERKKERDRDPAGARLAEAWGRALAPSIRNAREAVEAAGRKWELPILFPDGLAKHLGGLASTVKPTSAGKRQACPRLFVYGSCKLAKCRLSHGFTKEPNREQAKQFVESVEARCKEVKASPNA